MSWKILKGDKLSPLHYLKNFTEEEGRNILEAEVRQLAVQMVQGMTPEDFAGVFNHSIKREGEGVRIEVAVKVSALGEQITQFNRAKIARIIEEEKENI
jgi:hypothetical protein